MRSVVALRVRQRLLERGCQRAAHLVLRLGHHARGHRHLQHLGHHHAGLAHALLEFAPQQARHRLHRRAVVPGRHPCRQFAPRHQPARRAPDVEALMIRDDRADLRQLVDPMVDHRPGQLTRGEVRATVPACRRAVLLHVVHVDRVRGEPRRVTRLPAALAPLAALGLDRSRAGLIRRGRLGRVLGVLPQPRLQLDDVRQRARQLLLQRCDQRDEFVVCGRCRDLAIQIRLPRMSRGS